MRDYLDRLWLVHGDGLETTLDYLHEYVRMAQFMGHTRVMLIVDYAQRIPIRPTVGYMELSEAMRIDLVMRGLKGIAINLGIPVLAVAAADAEGLRQQRIHFENLWGPATVQYEPDVALILNRDGLDDVIGARTVRLAIEKNRHGPSEVEYRHQLHGAYYRLGEAGERVDAQESYQAERINLRAQQRTSARPGLDPVAVMLFLSALGRRSEDGEGEAFQRLLLQAMRSDDGGAAMLAEITERLGYTAP
jgi:hypothetical protein